MKEKVKITLTPKDNKPVPIADFAKFLESVNNLFDYNLLLTDAVQVDDSDNSITLEVEV